jgi:hypothetical protein
VFEANVRLGKPGGNLGSSSLTVEGKISRAAEALWRGDVKKAKELGAGVEKWRKETGGEGKHELLSEALRIENYLKIREGNK